MGIFAAVLSWLGGSTLDRILTTVDKKFDNDTERQRIKADVTEKAINAEIDALRVTASVTTADKLMSVWRGLFVVPTAIYYGAIIADSLFHFTWNVSALPSPYDTWGAAIVGAIFVTDAITSGIKKLRG